MLWSIRTMFTLLRNKTFLIKHQDGLNLKTQNNQNLIQNKKIAFLYTLYTYYSSCTVKLRTKISLKILKGHMNYIYFIYKEHVKTILTPGG